MTAINSPSPLDVTDISYSVSSSIVGSSPFAHKTPDISNEQSVVVRNLIKLPTSSCSADQNVTEEHPPSKIYIFCYHILVEEYLLEHAQ